MYCSSPIKLCKIRFSWPWVTAVIIKCVRATSRVYSAMTDCVCLHEQWYAIKFCVWLGKNYRNVLCAAINRLFSCANTEFDNVLLPTQTLSVVHSRIYRRGSTNTLYSNSCDSRPGEPNFTHSHETWTTDYCFDSSCFRTISVLPPRVVWNVSVIIGTSMYFNFFEFLINIIKTSLKFLRIS